LFCFLTNDEGDVFTKAEIKSSIAVAMMVKNNGGKVFENLQNMIIF